MNVLVLGATGFVGSWVADALSETGLNILAASRNQTPLNNQFPSLACDFSKDLKPTDWLTRLNDIDVLVNCVGIFYHTDKEQMWNIHFHTPKALYEAAELCNIKQIIHLSALGIDEYSNEYGCSKQAIEHFLKTLSIPHVILRPSFIYGPGSGGGMNVLRTLAVCPALIPLPGDGNQEFQPIYVGDLAKAISNLIINPPLNPALTLTAVPIQRIKLRDMLLSIRQWLGLKRVFFIKIPFQLLYLSAWFGDNRSFSRINTPAIDMLQQGSYSTEDEAVLFQKTTGVTPINFEEGLKKMPSSQMERWYPRLLIIRPLLRFSLVIMWIMSALTSILPETKAGSYVLLTQTELPFSLQPIVLYGAALLNLLIGCSLLLNYEIKINCLIQLLIISMYSLIISIKLPYLWLEPFGPVVKNIPILISIGILYILES